MTLINEPTSPYQVLPNSPSEGYAEQLSQGDGDAQSSGNGVNVGSGERVLSGVVGAALLTAGLSRKSGPGLLVAGVGGMLAYRAMSGHCGAYAALGIDTADRDTNGAAPAAYHRRGLHLAVSFTIANKSADELYTYWRDFKNLPRIFQHLETVAVAGDKRSHWVATGPMNMKYEWDAEVINDVPGALIAWRSLAGADVDNAGSVRFVKAPGDRGTELKVTMDYIPPAGAVGKTIATLLGQNPDHQIREDLRRFKWTMEAGEVPTINGQSRGNCSG